MLVLVSLLAQGSIKPLIDLPFRHEPGRIWIEGKLNGIPVRAMFDSGAGGIFVEEATAKRVGGKRGRAFKATALGGSAKAWEAEKLDFTLADLPDRFPASSIVSLGRAPRNGAFEVAAGFDLLRPFVVELDYANSRLRFFDPDRYAPATGAVALPIAFDDDCPTVRMKLRLPGGEERTAVVLIDTGSLPSIEITRRYAKRDGADVRYRDLPIQPGLCGIGGTTTVRLVDGLKADLAGFKLEGQAALHMTEEDDAGTASGYDALIGEGLLRHFDLAFDYPHLKLWIKPNGR